MEFEVWLAGKEAVIEAKMKAKLLPHEYHIMREAGTERAFTGEYLHEQEVGVYKCKGCDQNLFMNYHKFQNPSGYATFWMHMQNSVKFVKENLEIKG